jgi:hypothetical protein
MHESDLVHKDKDPLQTLSNNKYSQESMAKSDKVR